MNQKEIITSKLLKINVNTKKWSYNNSKHKTIKIQFKILKHKSKRKTHQSLIKHEKISINSLKCNY